MGGFSRQMKCDRCEFACAAEKWGTGAEKHDCATFQPVSAGFVFACVSDDQLHAEWMRRHPNQRLTALSGVTDDQLRAECERRFPRGFGVVHEVTLRELDSAREQLRVACEKWKADVAERDEWRRRAEAAERDRDNWRALAEEYRPCEARDCERGPGIAATPSRDTAHYVDPLDLLCEDLLCEDA